jgi:hypothetical protein
MDLLFQFFKNPIFWIASDSILTKTNSPEFVFVQRPNDGHLSFIAQRPNDEKFASQIFRQRISFGNSSLRGVYDELRTESSEQYIHKSIILNF